MRSFKHARLLSITLAILLSGILNVIPALAAEVINTEAQLNVDDTIIIVQQGYTADFKIKLSASGDISNLNTQASPATVTVNTIWSISNGGVAESSVTSGIPSEAKSFWASGGGSGNSPVTWTGAPSRYVIDSTVSTVADTELGIYDSNGIEIVDTITSDGTGNRALIDNSKDKLRFSVVADTTSPAITVSAPTSTGSHGWFNTKPVALGITATDPHNVTAIYVNGTAIPAASITGLNTPTAAATYNVADEGLNSIVVTARDGKGNTGAQSGSTTTAALRIDTVAPVITAGAWSGTAGNNGWYTSDVTVPFAATDSTSGFDASGTSTVNLASKTTSGEGSNLSVISDGISDYAGNLASGITENSIKVDKTGPVITAGAWNGTAGDNGWYTSDVTVPFTATDDASGFDVVGTSSMNLASKTTSGEGNNLSVISGGISDYAGNLASGITENGIKVDKTGPVITAGAWNGTAGDNGWYTSDVTVPFTATDGTSGFDASGTSPISLNSKTTSGEGSDLSVISDEISDYAGNLASGITENGIKVDKTGPVITAGEWNGTHGDNGWYTSDVTVPFTATDDVSGFGALGTSSFSLDSKTTTGEGSDLSVLSDGISDYAGLMASGITVNGIKVDKTVPMITAGAWNGTLGNNGWYISDVTVPFTATDDISGFDAFGISSFILDSKTTTGEGSNLSVVSDGSFDYAGLTASGITVDGIKVDKTEPIISAGAWSGTPGENGWYISEVTVPFTATDDVSGFDALGTSTTSLVSKTTSSEGSNLSLISDDIPDYAGNLAPGITENGIKVDKTGPKITAGAWSGTLGDNGWYTSDVTVNFTAEDDVSGFDALGTSPINLTSKTTSGEGNNLSVTSDSATNWAGIISLGITVIGIKVDQTKPLVTFDPSSPKVYYQGQSALVNWTATDDGSGLQSAASGNFIPNTATVGEAFTTSVIATDIAGNTETYVFTYTIIPIVLPVINNVTVNPTPVGSSISVSTNITAGTFAIGTVQYKIDEGEWNNLLESGGSYSIPSGVAAGVHDLYIKAVDTEGNESIFYATYLVVYDSNGGFVTGGGWIDSPAGAYADDPTVSGKATFGFVSKYKKGATVPTGNTEFQFKAGSLNFSSTSYEWLVVAGTRAQYKGTGTINGTGSYGFMLTAIDGGTKGSDQFRIKIWNKTTGNVVYDNKMGLDDDLSTLTTIGGGSIVIHK